MSVPWISQREEFDDHDEYVAALRSRYAGGDLDIMKPRVVYTGPPWQPKRPPTIHHPARPPIRYPLPDHQYVTRPQPPLYIDILPKQDKHKRRRKSSLWDRLQGYGEDVYSGHRRGALRFRG